jgi:hypothetical protein
MEALKPRLNSSSVGDGPEGADDEDFEALAGHIAENVKKQTSDVLHG